MGHSAAGLDGFGVGLWVMVCDLGLWLGFWSVDETTSWTLDSGLWSGSWAIIWTMDCVCGYDLGLWSMAESVTWILETVDIMVESRVIR